MILITAFPFQVALNQGEAAPPISQSDCTIEVHPSILSERSDHEFSRLDAERGAWAIGLSISHESNDADRRLGHLAQLHQIWFGDGIALI